MLQINQMNSGMQKYIIKQKIGVGSFGQVFQVHDTKRNQTFAMKKMKQHFSSEQYVKELMEVKIMSKLRHPNIIELRQYSYDKQSQQGNLFFEYCQSDICKKFCYNHKQRPPESQIKKHIFEIASALCFAHSKNFIHRDIKPQNILIQKNQFQGKQFDVAKLCDFGISKKADELPLTDYVGTRWYRAPQLLIKMKNYSKNVDIFSLGCIMAEFYNMQILFNGKNSIDQLVLIMKKLGTPTKQSWPQFSNWCKLKGITYGKYQRSEDPIIFKAKRDDLAEDLIQKMLVMNPKNRISSAEYVFAKNSVLKHPYFNDIRSQLLARQYAARPVRQVSVQQSQNHEITSTKSLKQIQNSSKSVQNAQVDTHHSTHKKQEGNLSTKKSDEKNLKMKESKQTQSSQAIKEVKDIKELQTDISRPPVIKKTINQRQKAKSPVFYSPYSPNGGKGNSHKSKEKKFDYYLTYVVGRMNQNRTQSNYQQSNSNYISSNYSHHQPQSK